MSGKSTFYVTMPNGEVAKRTSAHDYRFAVVAEFEVDGRMVFADATCTRVVASHTDRWQYGVWGWSGSEANARKAAQQCRNQNSYKGNVFVRNITVVPVRTTVDPS